MALFSVLIIVAISICLLIQLDFLFHIREPLWQFRTIINRLINGAFVATFLIALFLAYEIRRLQAAMSKFGYHSYKKHDDFQRQVTTTTNKALKQLTSSPAFKKWETERRQPKTVTTEPELDSVSKKFFNDIDNAVFGF